MTAFGDMAPKWNGHRVVKTITLLSIGKRFQAPSWVACQKKRDFLGIVDL